MNTTQTNFRDTALASELVTEDQLRHAMNELATAPESDSSSSATLSEKKIAQQLVEMKVISAYQADQLLTGRTKLNLGPYIVTGWIGQGGMGQVFKAVHAMLGRECAVKVLPSIKRRPRRSRTFAARFARRQNWITRILCSAFDAGEDGNVHYLVVEYVPGTDLQTTGALEGEAVRTARRPTS